MLAVGTHLGIKYNSVPNALVLDGPDWSTIHYICVLQGKSNKKVKSVANLRMNEAVANLINVKNDQK